MNIIQRKDWQSIIEGANLFGTGGGGTISGASAILAKINKKVLFTTIDELEQEAIICTVFGVGGKQNCDPILSSRVAIEKFQQVLKKEIDAIIPVENGPMAVANAIFISSELDVPVLDSDIVGMRSSPEVYLETISIPNLQRVPCVISDGKKTQIITENLPLEKLEKIFRDFAIAAGGDAIVAGYPLCIKDIKSILPKNSISEAQRVGKLLQKMKKNTINISTFCTQSGWKVLGKGKIISQERSTDKGFSKGLYKIKNENDVFTVLFKNENLVVIKNDITILTCPDSISVVNMKSWEAINNFNANTEQTVIILGKKAVPIWRTPEGKKLFSPKNLGLPYAQVLL